MSASDRQRGWPGVRAENVVLADDQALVRSGLHALLSSSDDLEVVGEARDGRDAVAVVSRTRPDVVLMDVRMPGVDGIAATRQITADPRLSGVAIIMLTTFDEDDHIFAAIRAGASGYLLKDAEPDDLRDAIRVVAAGDALLSASVTRKVMEGIVSGPAGVADHARLNELTEREREVLAGVGRGLSNKAIAGQIHISPATARTYVSRMLTKLGARDRAQLVVIAYQTGLVNPRPVPGDTGPSLTGRTSKSDHISVACREWVAERVIPTVMSVELPPRRRSHAYPIHPPQHVGRNGGVAGPHACRLRI
jgi:DNA-binding NarL/FixJ family response regulator